MSLLVGAEGGWAYTFGAAPTTKTTLSVAMDDIGAAYRTHTTEQIDAICAAFADLRADAGIVAAELGTGT